jgi:chaperone modulatory protein CbpM
MRSDEILHAALLEEAALSLEEFARACAAPPDWVRIHVASGALSVSGERPAAWRFGSRELWRARRMRALERDFDADPELAALMADMLEEMARLRRRLRQAGLAEP